MTEKKYTKAEPENLFRVNNLPLTPEQFRANKTPTAMFCFLMGAVSLLFSYLYTISLANSIQIAVMAIVFAVCSFGLAYDYFRKQPAEDVEFWREREEVQRKISYKLRKKSVALAKEKDGGYVSGYIAGLEAATEACLASGGMNGPYQVLKTMVECAYKDSGWMPPEE